MENVVLKRRHGTPFSSCFCCYYQAEKSRLLEYYIEKRVKSNILLICLYLYSFCLVGHYHLATTSTYNNIYLQQHPLTLTPTPTPTTIMFNTWKYDAETDQVQSVRNGFDPVTARSSSHQACDRCHEKKVSQHPPSTCTSLPLYESYTNISTAQVQWR